MKLQYKKYILLLMLYTMCIGSITLWFPASPPEKETIKHTNAQDDDDSTSVALTTTPLPTVPVTVSPTPTIAPTPTPLPVYPLIENGFSDITKLMKTYYKAKLDCDVEQLKELASDPSYTRSKEELQEEVHFYEDFRNIKCYVKKGYQEGTYFIYVYYDIKVINIDTLLPALRQFYIVTVDGKLKIFTPDYDAETDEYFLARRQDEDVIELFDEVNRKYEEAIAKDEVLNAFCNGSN